MTEDDDIAGVFIPHAFTMTTTLGGYQFSASGGHVEVMLAYDRFAALLTTILSVGQKATETLAMVAATQQSGKGGQQH